MKIENSHKPSLTPVSPPAPRPATPSPAAVADAVSLSPLAGALVGGDKMPVNNQRIQEIKAAIAEGRFKINADAIADRLLESASELIRSAGQRQA